MFALSGSADSSCRAPLEKAPYHASILVLSLGVHDWDLKKFKWLVRRRV